MQSTDDVSTILVTLNTALAGVGWGLWGRGALGVGVGCVCYAVKQREIFERRRSPTTGFPVMDLITHLSQAFHKRDIGKQCRPRSGPKLLALNSGISIKYGNSKI